MQVNGIHGSQGVSPTNRVESAKATQSTAITNPTDQVEISPEAEIASQAADLVSQIHELPEIRVDRVDQIREAIDSKDNRLLFSGWMFASTPGISALEHPVYDVWVLDCLVSE